MKKLLLFLAMHFSIATAMENPATLPTTFEKKRKKPDQATEQFRLDLATQLRDYKRNGLNPYRTSLPLWDPITNHETITAYVMNKEIGHVSFSDNTKGDTRYNLLTPKQGTIHTLYIDPRFRMQHFGYDLFRQAVLFLKARGVSEIILIKRMDIEANEDWRIEQKQTDTILYNMLCRVANNYHLPTYNYETQSAFYKDKSSKRDTSIERYYKITFVNRAHTPTTETLVTPKKVPFSKFQSNLDVKPKMESRFPAHHIQETIPIAPIVMPAPAPAQLPDTTIDFLQEYIQEEKKSGESLPNRPDIEFTLPIPDELYDNSFEINLRNKEHATVGQVTYGQEIDKKDEGAIHYFYLSPKYLNQNLGYPLFKKAIEELLNMKYKKINWHASLQKGIKRETLLESMKYFAKKTQEELGLQSVIENDPKNTWIKLYLSASAAGSKK